MSVRICLSLIFAASILSAQTKTKDNPNDWPMYTRDLAGTRYSPLKQINTSNVSKLDQAWTYKLVGAAPVPAPGRENEGVAGEAPAPGGRGAAPAGGAAAVGILKPRPSSLTD